MSVSSQYIILKRFVYIMTKALSNSTHKYKYTTQQTYGGLS